MTYALSRRARLDVHDIWQYIARDNETAADRFIDRLIQTFRLLGDNPYLGRARDELRRGYRSLAVGQYLIFYTVTGPEIRIVRVLHGRRDIDEAIG